MISFETPRSHLGARASAPAHPAPAAEVPMRCGAPSGIVASSASLMAASSGRARDASTVSLRKNQAGFLSRRPPFSCRSAAAPVRLVSRARCVCALSSLPDFLPQYSITPQPLHHLRVYEGAIPHSPRKPSFGFPAASCSRGPLDVDMPDLVIGPFSGDHQSQFLALRDQFPVRDSHLFAIAVKHRARRLFLSAIEQQPWRRTKYAENFRTESDPPAHQPREMILAAQWSWPPASSSAVRSRSVSIFFRFVMSLVTFSAAIILRCPSRKGVDCVSTHLYVPFSPMMPNSIRNVLVSATVGELFESASGPPADQPGHIPAEYLVRLVGLNHRQARGIDLQQRAVHRRQRNALRPRYPESRADGFPSPAAIPQPASAP